MFFRGADSASSTLLVRAGGRARQQMRLPAPAAHRARAHRGRSWLPLARCAGSQRALLAAPRAGHPAPADSGRDARPLSLSAVLTFVGVQGGREQNSAHLDPKCQTVTHQKTTDVANTNAHTNNTNVQRAPMAAPLAADMWHTHKDPHTHTMTRSGRQGLPLSLHTCPYMKTQSTHTNTRTLMPTHPTRSGK